MFSFRHCSKMSLPPQTDSGKLVHFLKRQKRLFNYILRLKLQRVTLEKGLPLRTVQSSKHWDFWSDGFINGHKCSLWKRAQKLSRNLPAPFFPQCPKGNIIFVQGPFPNWSILLHARTHGHCFWNQGHLHQCTISLPGIFKLSRPLILPWLVSQVEFPLKIKSLINDHGALKPDILMHYKLSKIN